MDIHTYTYILMIEVEIVVSNCAARTGEYVGCMLNVIIALNERLDRLILREPHLNQPSNIFHGEVVQTVHCSLFVRIESGGGGGSGCEWCMGARNGRAACVGRTHGPSEKQLLQGEDIRYTTPRVSASIPMVVAVVHI